jgi:CRISPR-associated protein Csy1
MTEQAEHRLRSQRFRSTISDFIEDRKIAKLNGKGDPEVAAKYEYFTWLGEAARRVSQIQAVTHVLKATHPDARGTNLHVDPKRLSAHSAIGSHSLGEDFADDVVGNAAALDVFKFLKLEVENRPLLEWMQANDADLQAALSEDSETAEVWMQAFAALVREEQQPTSHPLAKQIYWLTGDEPTDDRQYQLLQPLFASSLTHMVHAEIQDARFGEANKLARQAYREGKPHDKPYRHYPALVVRKLGGTKPQNVSQLNSERGGINYLLDSSPPKWGQERTLNLSNTESAFYAFRWFDDVDYLLKKLQKLLRTDPSPNKKTRDLRKVLERELGQQMVQFGAAVRLSHTPGWTRDAKCRLPLCEQLWLDSERTELPVRSDGHAEDDLEFNKAYLHGDWPDEVAQRFGAWLNERLRTAGINTVGDSELRHWAGKAIIDAQWPIPIQRRAQGGAA